MSPSPITIDAEIIRETPPKLLPMIPMSIVCPHCKQETGFTKEHILEMPILDDIRCPSCDKVIYSNKPERVVFSWQSSNNSQDFHSWDY